MSTLESDVKTMIIIMFILMLTRVNDQHDLRPDSCLGLTPKLDFKTKIIVICILMLTGAKGQLTHDPGLAPSRVYKL
jgi:hypothetical protein